MTDFAQWECDREQINSGSYCLADKCGLVDTSLNVVQNYVDAPNALADRLRSLYFLQ